MAKQTQGYPSRERIQQGVAAYEQDSPPIVYRTCRVKLHHVSQRKTAALLSVFKNYTLAAGWMLRDIEQRRPQQWFAKYHKRNNTSYYTRGIAQELDTTYRARIRGRYALNSHLFGGLCSSLAALLAAWLHKMAEAQQKGVLKRYEECAAFVVPVGKHAGKTLGAVGRKVAYGYAFLQLTREQYAEALHHITVLLDQHPEEEELRKEAEQYVLPAASQKKKRGKKRTLGSMRRETLQRFRAWAERGIAEAETYEELRKVAKQYLQFTPPGFPSIKSDGLSPDRQNELENGYQETLEAFGALPVLLDDDGEEEDEPPALTDNERSQFAELLQRSYAATHRHHYAPLRWNRADGILRGRDVGVGYDAAKGRYVLLLSVLDAQSRHRRPLQITNEVSDVNNPTGTLSSKPNPTIAMAFEIECDDHARSILDHARNAAMDWKGGKETAGGPVRSAVLHARYDTECDCWWFEAHIAVATIPKIIHAPAHVMGVHIDPQMGVFVSVLDLDGTCLEQFCLDEQRIVKMLANKEPEHQATLTREQRTNKEWFHRLADALVVVAQRYQALVGIENVTYRRTQPHASQIRSSNQYSSSSLLTLLTYKLPLAELPGPLDTKWVSPRRDCGWCGTRQQADKKRDDVFTCATCGHTEPCHANSAREVARRTLWVLAQKRKRGTIA